MITEEKLWECLRRIQVPYPVPFKFDGGVTHWLCPPGNAEGSDFNGHGYDTGGLNITIWPHLKHYALYEGLGSSPEPTQICTSNGVRLWYQEEYVYRLELRDAMRVAILQMDKLFPRSKGHKENDIDPWPEDFGMKYFVRQVMIESIEKWLVTI